MAVLWEPNSAFGFDMGVGFEFVDTREVADFGFEPETMRGFGDFGFFVESLLRLAKHEESFLDEGKIFFLGELDVQASTGKGEVAKESFAVGNVLLIGVAHEEKIQWAREKSRRGRRKKGLLGLSIHLRPWEMTPGAARGMKWLGTIMPALPLEQEFFRPGSFSTMRTGWPRLASEYPMERPMTPPPTMRISFMG